MTMEPDVYKNYEKIVSAEMFVETCDPNVYSIATVLNFTSMWPSQTNVNPTMHL